MLGILSFGGLLGALVLGTLRKPAVALAALLCLYGLKQWGQNSSAFFAQHRTVANLSIGLLIVLAAGIRLAKGHCLLCKLTPAARLVFALYVYAFLTLIWVPNFDDAINQWSLHWMYVVTIVGLAPMIIASVDDIRIAFNWTVVVGGIICGLALFFGNWGSRGLLVYGDIYQTQVNALAIAGLGGTVSIVGTLSLQKGQNKLLRLACVLAIPLGIAVVLRSLSRGQLIASGVAILLAWPIAYRVKNTASFFQFAIGLAALAVVGWLAFDLLQVDSARWSSERGADDAEDRLKSATGLLSFALGNPLTMLFGLGNSSAFYYVGFYPHIALLEVLAEEGLIGFGLYAAVVTIAFRSLRKLASIGSQSSDPMQRAAIASLSAAFIFEFLLTLKQGSLLSCTYAFAYAILLQKLAIDAEERRAIPETALGDAPGAPARFGNLMR